MLDEQLATKQTMVMVKQKKPQNKANKPQSGEQNNNQPDHNGVDLPCGGRQPLNVAADPPNLVKNGKVSFGESAGNKKVKTFYTT